MALCSLGTEEGQTVSLGRKQHGKGTGRIPRQRQKKGAQDAWESREGGPGWPGAGRVTAEGDFICCTPKSGARAAPAREPRPGFPCPKTRHESAPGSLLTLEPRGWGCLRHSSDQRKRKSPLSPPQSCRPSPHRGVLARGHWKWIPAALAHLPKLPLVLNFALASVCGGGSRGRSPESSPSSICESPLSASVSLSVTWVG